MKPDRDETQMSSTEKSAHAAHQAKYHRAKLQTHQKMCVWVPHARAEAFKAAVERMKKKWGKEKEHA